MTSGKRLEYDNIDIDSIDIDDIAHALSNICRYSGNCNQFYSVAQHSVLVSYYVSKEYTLQALMHDAAEAYISDIPSPLKQLLPKVNEIEENIIKHIFFKFNIDYPISEEVKKVDKQVLLLEKELLINNQNDWGIDVDPLLIAQNPLEHMGFWEPKLAKMKFMSRFRELTEREEI